MYDYKSKENNINQLNSYMLTKTLSMFEYSGLPETIPHKELEKLLQVKGYAFITKVDGELYAFSGGLGGVPDVYNNPTEIIINNPALNFNKKLDIKKDGVLIYNDDMGIGLIPLYDKAHTFIIENDINMMVHGYNTRTQKVISAPDDKTKQSAELMIKKSIDGDLAIIGNNPMFDGVSMQSANVSGSASITSMVEFQQYIKASLFNEVGLSANFNMKRERLISSELDASEDSLFPLVYNMMKCRLAAIELINEMFGTKIQVDFGSVWHFKNKQLVDGVIDSEQTINEDDINEDTRSTERSDKGDFPDIDEPTINPTGTAEQTDQAEEVREMLLDADLSDDDKLALKELLIELEGSNNE